MRLVACGVLVVGLAPAVALASFDGLWNGRFGGVALDVLGTEVSLYQVSESHRWPLDRFTLDGEGRFQTGDGRRYRLTRDGERLDILDERDAVFLSFLPTVGLPPLREPTDDPAIVFDVFWEAFAENHALFDLTGVDWAAVRDSGREAAIAADGPDALFEVLSDLLAPLNDRHTTLVWPAAGRLYRSGRASDPFWQGRANTFLLNIAVNYLGRPLQSRLADPRLRFGILPGNVGYLYVADFLDGGALPSFATTLTLVLEELRDTDGLVVDLRFNPGGVDRNTRAFMEQLWPPDQQAAYFRERRLTGPLPGDFEEAELLRIAPRENAFYRRPIVFLTGADTASAAETVLLAAVGLPRVVQIGEASAGVFSNLLLRFYPNGWYSTLSNEQFYSLTG
ncbi:MAG: S41 family peptidase, partial [Pseudomonadota bacterium]